MRKYSTAICLGMVLFSGAARAADIPLEYLRIILEKPTPTMREVKVEGIAVSAKRYEETCGYGDKAFGTAAVELDGKGRPTRVVYEAREYQAKNVYEFFYDGDKLARETKKHTTLRERTNSSSEYRYDRNGMLFKKISRMSGYPDSETDTIDELKDSVSFVSANEETGNLHVSYRGDQAAGIGQRQVVYDSAGRIVYQKIIGNYMFGVGPNSSSGFDPHSISENTYIYEVDKSGRVRVKLLGANIKGVNYLTEYQKYNESGWLVERWYADLMRDGSYSKIGKMFKKFYEVDAHGSWVRSEDWQVDSNGGRLKTSEWCDRKISYSSKAKR